MLASGRFSKFLQVVFKSTAFEKKCKPSNAFLEFRCPMLAAREFKLGRRQAWSKRQVWSCPGRTTFSIFATSERRRVQFSHDHDSLQIYSGESSEQYQRLQKSSVRVSKFHRRQAGANTIPPHSNMAAATKGRPSWMTPSMNPNQHPYPLTSSVTGSVHPRYTAFDIEVEMARALITSDPDARPKHFRSLFEECLFVFMVMMATASTTFLQGVMVINTATIGRDLVMTPAHMGICCHRLPIAHVPRLHY